MSKGWRGGGGGVRVIASSVHANRRRPLVTVRR